MIKPIIELNYKESYGNKRFYPNCGVSKVIVELMKTKTFTEEQINILKTEFDVKISGIYNKV